MPALDHPLMFTPLLQTRVWGGSVLRERRAVHGATAAANEPVGESWEIVDRPEAQSVVANGPLKSRTLHELFVADRAALCGKGIDPASPDVFPLLLKLLDARDDLSVQVHPDDDYAGAKKAGELGKTEAWYVLEADADATIYRGLAPGVDRDAFAAALADGQVAPLLRRLDARPGDAFHLPAGMIHALGAGVRIAEIQQNSDTTYRVFDWNRPGLDGRPRALHIEDALAVTDFGDQRGQDRPQARDIPTPGCRREELVRDVKFAMERLRAFAGAPVALATEGGFHIVLGLRGQARLRAPGGEATLQAWDSALLPAAVGEYTIEAGADCELLLFYRP